jgi:hypothetical protein
MTKAQAPMTNETETKRQCPITGAPLVIAVCSLIGHWCLVIGHSGGGKAVGV